jgi:hypothetical protein
MVQVPVPAQSIVQPSVQFRMVHAAALSHVMEQPFPGQSSVAAP